MPNRDFVTFSDTLANAKRGKSGHFLITSNPVAKYEWGGEDWIPEVATGSIVTVEKTPLNTGQSADGAGSPFAWVGGEGSFVSYGTFGGGTNILEFSPDSGTTWIACPGVTLNANGVVNFKIGPCDIRSNLSGATTPNLNTEIL